MSPSSHGQGLTHYTQAEDRNDIPRTCAEVILFLGSCVSIFLTRSFALFETDGHGSLLKSISPSSIASNIPFSFSAERKLI